MGRDIRISDALRHHNAKQTLATDVRPLDILQIISPDLQVTWEPIVRISEAWGDVIFHLTDKSTFSIRSNSFVWIA